MRLSTFLFAAVLIPALGWAASPPTVPTGVAANAPNCSTVNVTWNASTDPDGDLSGYRVNRFNGNAWVQIATVTAPATNYTDPGRAALTSYYYAISAFDVAGNQSALSAWAQATTPSCGGTTTTTSGGTTSTTSTTTSSTTTTTAVTCTPTPTVTLTCPGSAVVGTNITVPVTANMGTHVLGSYGLTITYSTAVMHITAIAGAATGLFTATPTSNSGDWTSGTSLWSSYQTTSFVSPSGAVPVARVTFHVDGGGGGAPTLGVTVRSLTETSAIPITGIGIGCP